MFLRTIAKCALSRSTKPNLLARIPLKTGLISRQAIRSGLFANADSNINSVNHIHASRSYHLRTGLFAKKAKTSEKQENEDPEYVKPIDFGKPMQRVAKIIASYGQCSKAQAEILISEGRVKVNGELIKEIPTQVPVDSKIYVDDVLIKKPKPRVFIHYKKRMFLAKLSFEADPRGRRNLFAVLQAMGVPSVVPVDTLDYSSEGIMLLTNDSMYKSLLGKTARESWECLYKLRVIGEVTEKFIAKSRDKITYHGETLPGIKIHIEEKQQGNQDSYNNWLSVVAPAAISHVALKDHFKRNGILVSRLLRLTYGPYSLDNVNAGDVHEVPIRVIEKNIVKEGEELPIIQNLTEVTEPKKRPLSRRQKKLKDKGLYDPEYKQKQALREEEGRNDENEEIDEEVDEEVDEEDIDDEVEDEMEDEQPQRRAPSKSRASDMRTAYQSKKANSFDRTKPFKGRFAETKSWDKNASKNRSNNAEDVEDEDSSFKKISASRGAKPWDRERSPRRESKPWDSNRESKPWDRSGAKKRITAFDDDVEGEGDSFNKRTTSRESKPWDRERSPRRASKPWDNSRSNKRANDGGDNAEDEGGSFKRASGRESKPWDRERSPRREAKSWDNNRESKPWDNNRESKPWDRSGAKKRITAFDDDVEGEGDSFNKASSRESKPWDRERSPRRDFKPQYTDRSDKSANVNEGEETSFKKRAPRESKSFGKRDSNGPKKFSSRSSGSKKPRLTFKTKRSASREDDD